MKESFYYDESSIAPCGINCGTCIAYLRKKNPCCGCRIKGSKPKHCVNCLIINCEYLEQTKSKFCYECVKYPCLRLRRLDKRYRTNYEMSLIANLENIRILGLSLFLKSENMIWKCNNCGNPLSAHRNHCMVCKEEKNVLK